MRRREIGLSVAEAASAKSKSGRVSGRRAGEAPPEQKRSSQPGTRSASAEDAQGSGMQREAYHDNNFMGGRGGL